jgi:hypothetical protein
MVEGLIISILTSEREVSIKGIQVTCLINLIHIHFVDGVMIFGVGTRKEMSRYDKILDLYYKETNTKVNVQKLSILFNELKEHVERKILQIIPYTFIPLNKRD